MVALVEDDESEAVADELHHQHRRVVGADRDIPDILASAAEHSYFTLEKGTQHFLPLDHEIDGRHDDQSRAPDRGNRQNREISFAGARRHDDQSAPFGFAPFFQGFPLVRHGRVRIEYFQIERMIVSCGVFDFKPVFVGGAHDLFVIGSGGAVRVDADVLNCGGSDGFRQLRSFFGFDEQGARRKFESYLSHCVRGFQACL